MACSALPQACGDHAQTVANHYNQLEESGLAVRTLSRIYYLRNFNNWIKSVLIVNALNRLRESDPDRPISVLDLCSGKGGDLLKWKKGRIRHVVCADIAATSVEQSEERHKQNAERERNNIYTAQFVVADCTKDRLKDKYRDASQMFDLVSCQFSFHYCFESYPQAMMMLRNAAECLKVGGYFIGTTPDANEIVRRFRQSQNNSFGNEVYTISFPKEDKTKFPLFGAMYHFHLEGVVDCPEFLVYFPVLEKMAAQFGLKLVKKQRFADFFKDNVNSSDNLSLLSNMQALELYPPLEGAATVSTKTEDYQVANDFLQALSKTEGQKAGASNQPKRIGTMSQAEWEAATLYLVFMFQKVEDICPPFKPTTVSSQETTSQATTDG